jgi:hypothetical protein
METLEQLRERYKIAKAKGDKKQMKIIEIRVQLPPYYIEIKLDSYQEAESIFADGHCRGG